MATDPHGGEFVPTGPTHGLEYEPDEFAVKTILAVPAAVVVTAVLAFLVTHLIFNNIFDPAIQRKAPDNEAAAAKNDRDMNDRFGDISSSDPKAAVQQPRLEGLRQTKVEKRGDFEIRSTEIPTQPLTKDTNNPPRIHPEDQLPSRIPELTKGGVSDVGVVRIGIDEAISQLIKGDHLKAREGAKELAIHADPDRPKESNGGAGKSPVAPKPEKK